MERNGLQAYCTTHAHAEIKEKKTCVCVAGEEIEALRWEKGGQQRARRGVGWQYQDGETAWYGLEREKVMKGWEWETT